MSELQEAITHLQEMEEDLVDTHHNVIQTMQNWVQEDSQLISMTQEVDYDQDGNEDTFQKNLELCLKTIAFLYSVLPAAGGHDRREDRGPEGAARQGQGLQGQPHRRGVQEPPAAAEEVNEDR